MTLDLQAHSPFLLSFHNCSYRPYIEGTNIPPRQFLHQSLFKGEFSSTRLTLWSLYLPLTYTTTKSGIKCKSQNKLKDMSNIISIDLHLKNIAIFSLSQCRIFQNPHRFGRYIYFLQFFFLIKNSAFVFNEYVTNYL